MKIRRLFFFRKKPKLVHPPLFTITSRLSKFPYNMPSAEGKNVSDSSRQAAADAIADKPKDPPQGLFDSYYKKP